ncbi:hypothetical protein M9H77_21599 [Catharanthus roseus]|uniref:Uncharacterized protein n=1 Tax=Catharanthus roseus TaxID=4058 RepID=A0ACC0ANH5_CATRO|nr:hypothetical protein M9H77_21599 [Catharanthus roseus]
MGRKIEMKKIEDIKKSQVTFSKRRTSLIKKAEQIAITCEVDVAFLAFSPSGRVSQFCSQERMEDLLNRYANLPAEKRLRSENEKLALEKGANNPLIFADDSQQHQSLKNNPNIAKVPTNIFDEMLGKGKGKGKEVADHAYGNSQTMLRSGVPIVPKTQTMPSYYLLQHHLSKKAMKLQQGESSSSFGNFNGQNANLITRDYLSKLSTAFPESSINNGKNTSVDAPAAGNENQPNLVLSLVNSAEATPLINPRASSPMLYDFLPSKNPKCGCSLDNFALDMISGCLWNFGSLIHWCTLLILLEVVFFFAVDGTGFFIPKEAMAVTVPAVAYRVFSLATFKLGLTWASF